MFHTGRRTASYLAFAASALALAGTSASAQQLQGSPLMDDLLACRALASDSERLSCLDRAASALDSAIGAGELTVVERQRAQAAERDSFGSAVAGTGRFFTSLFSREADAAGPQVQTYEDGAQLIRGADGDIESLRGVPVRSVRADPLGKLVVTLENGQVWRQIDQRRIDVPRDMNGVTADITRGAIGSFFMQLSTSHSQFRARRD
ncbi:hypothetical protein X907_2123 [Glycocaulis alkaliphilus]|uniref:Uncharacterized protein n=1 Tax=Glycocaulis alkaliphilus TaxID=1434191 RepID=A0A3T0EBE2_9PROT|nr:hypothetical protein [Glycocaulis alkaliphilus]AZU04644.1 hypothetical protein X907_2123 [Glycocaulis alkaliphilus]GGB68861.1 hypothetical protein GCM10007417_05820 [Glycocaulis alkaliphilus]